MTYAIGALIEPLSVAYNAVLRAAPYLGQPVVVAGAGPIGLAMALCARAAGASPVVITDLEDNRLQQARDMGFNKTLKIELGWDRLTTAENIRQVMGLRCLPQIVFECTGAASSINSACYVGGRKKPFTSWVDADSRRHSRMVEHYYKSGVESPMSRFH